MNLISAIIITHKSNRWIAKCFLRLISGQTKPDEIIIIDNGSPKRPKHIVEKIKKKCGKNYPVTYIENPENTGFAKAANQGAESSKKDYLLFINPDFFIDKKAISILKRTIKDSKKHDLIIGGRVFDTQNNAIQKTVARKPSLLTLIIEFTSLRKVFDYLGVKNLSGFWDDRSLVVNSEIAVDMVSGCFIFVKKSSFEKLKGFDENFFMYLEDLDFCLRAKRKGFQILYLPSAHGKHVSGASSIRQPNRIHQKGWDDSKRYFSIKHFGFGGYLLSAIFYLDDFLVKLKKLFFRKHV